MMKLALIAAIPAAIIWVRIICVALGVSGIKFVEQHSRHKWHGFAISYIVLGIASAFAVRDVYLTCGSLPVWAFLISSAGLVYFDPRRPPL